MPCKSASHIKQLRSVTGCCDALGKLRQLFRCWSFPNHDQTLPEFYDESLNEQIDVAQHLPIALHRFQSSAFSQAFSQAVCPSKKAGVLSKAPAERMPFFSHSAFRPRNNSVS